MRTYDVVYEPSKGGWSASIPTLNLTEEGATPEQIDGRIREAVADPTHGSDGKPTSASQAVDSNPVELRRVDRPLRTRVFTNKVDWLGPAIVVLSAWYFSAQILVAWTFRPPYDVLTNPISDLGATGCFQRNYNFCSPRWIWMDLSIGVLGAAMIIGAILIFTEFRFSGERREQIVAAFGFLLLSVSGVGAVLVACVPENLNTAGLHDIGAATTIAAGQLGILILGLVLRSIPDWLREFMIVTSLVVFLGGVPYALHNPHQAFGLGDGALERIIQYPQPLWLMLMGFYVSRNHWRNGVTGDRFRFEGMERKPDRGAFSWALRPATLKSRRSAARSGS